MAKIDPKRSSDFDNRLIGTEYYFYLLGRVLRYCRPSYRWRSWAAAPGPHQSCPTGAQECWANSESLLFYSGQNLRIGL